MNKIGRVVVSSAVSNGGPQFNFCTYCVLLLTKTTHSKGKRK